MKRSSLMNIAAVLGALLLAGALSSCGKAGASPDTVSLLLAQKTARGFSERAVSDEAVKTILEAGANAPSAMNKQPWYFTAVENKDVQNRIRELSREMMQRMRPAGRTQGGPEGGAGPGAGGPGMPEDRQAARAQGPGPQKGVEGGALPAAGQGVPPGAGGTGGRDPLEGAPVVIIISGTKDWRWTNFDCALATDRMAVAAGALGLGSHIVAGPVEALSGSALPEFKTLLALPEGMEPVSMILVGYEAESPDAVSKASTRKEGAFSVVK